MTPEQRNARHVGMIGRVIREGGRQLDEIPRMIGSLLEKEYWRRYAISSGEVIEPKTFCEFVTNDPPRGWGENPAKIEALLKDDPAVLAKWRKAMKRTNQYDMPNDNVIGQKAKQGNSKSYTLDRLERDHPELFKRVCAGELSANAAAIEAGFRKKRTPEETCLAAWGKVEQRITTLAAIVETLSDSERLVLADKLT